MPAKCIHGCRSASPARSGPSPTTTQRTSGTSRRIRSKTSMARSKFFSAATRPTITATGVAGLAPHSARRVSQRFPGANRSVSTPRPSSDARARIPRRTVARPCRRTAPSCNPRAGGSASDRPSPRVAVLPSVWLHVVVEIRVETGRHRDAQRVGGFHRGGSRADSRWPRRSHPDVSSASARAVRRASASRRALPCSRAAAVRPHTSRRRPPSAPV